MTRSFEHARQIKQIPISLSLTPLADPQGNHTAVVAVFATLPKGQKKQRADFIGTASREMRAPVAMKAYLALAMNNKVAAMDKTAP